MYDDLIDHDSVRARVEKRLEPRLRLLRQRIWLVAHIIFFIIVGSVFAGLYGHHALYSAITHSIPASSFTDPRTAQVYAIAASSYDTYSPYILVNLISFLWPVLLFLHMLTFWAASRRERIIEHAIEHELELEKMRLQIELAHAQDGIERREPEKPKRGASLLDDGELIFDEILSNQRESPALKRKAGT